MRTILCFLLFISTYSNAQITTEHVFNEQGYAQFSDIGNNDYKFIFIDYSASKMTIYNLDYTTYLSEYTLPLSLQEYRIGYITKSLFDCDEATLEFVMVNNVTTEFKVYRTNGTLLFENNNGQYVGCTDCLPVMFNDDYRPIVNTPNGTKLILTDPNNPTTTVYNLCGSLPLDTFGFTQGDNSITVYPVPNTSGRTLNFRMPENYSIQGTIEVFNSNMQLLDTFAVENTLQEYQKNYDFPTGFYFFLVRSNGKIVDTGKFIIKN